MTPPQARPSAHVLRSPARPFRILAARWPEPHPAPGGSRARELGMPAWPSPITARCSGWSTSTAPPRRPASSRSSAWRPTWRHAACTTAIRSSTAAPSTCCCWPRTTPATATCCRSPRAAQLDGFYYRPRIDHDYLAAHTEGLICTTGCLSGEIPRALADGRHRSTPSAWLDWYFEVFGPDRFFFELQAHDIPELTAVNRGLIELAPALSGALRRHQRCALRQPRGRRAAGHPAVHPDRDRCAADPEPHAHDRSVLLPAHARRRCRRSSATCPRR